MPLIGLAGGSYGTWEAEYERIIGHFADSGGDHAEVS